MSTPTLASNPPFETAQRRVGAYLRLCGLSPAVADRVGCRLVEQSVARGANLPAPSAEAEVERTIADIDHWAAHLVAERAGESDLHRGTRGRAQMFLANLPVRWPDSFLAPTPAPEAHAALTAAAPQATPALEPAVMSLQPFDLGPVSKMADETWRTFDKWPFLRGVVIWALFFALIGGAFYLVRF